MKKKMLLLLIVVSFLCVFCQIPILAKYKKNEIRVIKDATQIEAVSADDLPIGRYGRTIAITNYTFTSKMSGKLIKIVPKIEGILCVDADEGRTKILDKNLNQLSLNISEWDGNYYIGNVGKNDVYYIKIDHLGKEETQTVFTFMYSNDTLNVIPSRVYMQAGKDKYVYKNFSVKNRTKSKMIVNSVITDYKRNTYFYLQRKEKNRWKNITVRNEAKADEHSRIEWTFGLKNGDYRIAIKSGVGQFARIYLLNQNCTSKYQTKKSKAQKVKLKTAKENIYTPTEKASRWYRVYRKTSKYKRYVKMKVQNNSGKVKFTIYKKGRKKALKSYTLSGNKSKTYRLKSGKGTYYVKVSKSGSKMNGQYSIQYK